MSPAALDTRGLVLILAPLPGDAEAMAHVLGRSLFPVRICENVRAFAACFEAASGVLIVAEEALGIPGEAQRLADVLRAQPAWSDLPVILLASQGASDENAWALVRGLESVGNITILERPLRRSTLVNAVNVALRARTRQHELRAHKEHLERLVLDRTADLEESLRQLHSRERLAALGTLAAGLGHDIANLALPIRMRLEPLLTECATARAREDIDAIGTALSYLTNLSTGLRLMSMDPGREAGSGGVDDLSLWWAQAQGVFRGVLPRHVMLEGEFDPGMGVRVSAHRLTQAVFNLVQNAGEALAGSPNGLVRIRAERIDMPDGAPMIHLHVSDNGPGMGPEILGRCFEPYFSTKGRAIATGMGLGMVRGLVESAGGGVEVASQPGVGTTFTLRFQATFPGAHARPGLASRSSGARTALLSVADPRIHAISLMLLKGLGLSISDGTAESGAYDVCIVQDRPRAEVECLLKDSPSAHIVLVQTRAHPADQAWSGDDRVTTLPPASPPSALREALLAAVRERKPSTSIDAP